MESIYLLNSQDRTLHEFNDLNDVLIKNGNVIILAIDASELAEFAVQWYIDKIHKPGDKLIFVHCVELPEVNQARQVHMSPGVLSTMWKEEETKIIALENKLRAMIKNRGIMSSSIMRTQAGKPGEVLCRVAEEEDATLIVVGQRGKGLLRRTVLGSVSDYVVHHAHCPVIVCLHPCAIEKRRDSISSRSRHNSGDSLRSRQLSSDSSKSRGASLERNSPRNTPDSTDGFKKSLPLVPDANEDDLFSVCLSSTTELVVP